jgi:hypothetical protein
MHNNLQISAFELISKLSELNILVFLNGDDLKIESKSPLSNENRNLIRQNKPSLLNYLQWNDSTIKTQTHYLGMQPSPCTKPHRLKLFWSILGECIEERKQFIFQCENVDEADELRNLTYTLVFQINDRWEVLLDDLFLKANPPKE